MKLTIKTQATIELNPFHLDKVLFIGGESVVFPTTEERDESFNMLCDMGFHPMKIEHTLSRCFMISELTREVIAIKNLLKL